MKVRKLLSSRKNWTMRALARDGVKGVVPSRSELAVCWCTVGAIVKCYPNDQVPGVQQALASALYCKISGLAQLVARYVGCPVPEVTDRDVIVYVNDAYGYDVIYPVIKELDI